MAKMFLINMSHPLPETLKRQYVIITLEVKIPPEIVGSKNPNAISNYVSEQILMFLTAPINSKVFGAVQTGKYILNPPELKAACCTALSVFHGISGHFPQVIWQVRTDEGFEPIESPLKLQNIRDMVRSGRSFKETLNFIRKNT